MSEKLSFERLIQDGLDLSFSGWDFSVIGDRWQSDPTPWDYTRLARQRLSGIQRLLDMDTGGGEFLASLAPLPPETWATEGYEPNISVAHARLAPLGVQLVTKYSDDLLPFETGTFDLVLNRHGSFDGVELARILKPGGRFLTQQVGGKNNIRLNELLQDEVNFQYAYWTLDEVVRWLRAGDLEIIQAEEAFPEERFYDIGALVFYLRIISWQVADFSLDKYHDRLYAIHERIRREGCLRTHSHRILVEAKKS